MSYEVHLLCICQDQVSSLVSQILQLTCLIMWSSATVASPVTYTHSVCLCVLWCQSLAKVTFQITVFVGEKESGVSCTNWFITSPAACCHICRLSCPGRISSNHVVFPEIEQFAIISLLLPESLLCSHGQAANPLRWICSIHHSSAGGMRCHQWHVCSSWCNSLTGKRKVEQENNPILLLIIFSFGIKSLLVIVCDMYPPFISLYIFYRDWINTITYFLFGILG